MRKSNGEGTLYYSEKLKKYVGQVCLGRNTKGKLIRKSIYGDTKSYVHDKMVEIQSQYNVGIFADDKGITLDKWITRWFNTYKIHDYKQGTFEKEYRRSVKIRESWLGRKHLQDIKPMDIQEFINELSTTYSPKTVRNLMIILNSSFKQAVAEKLVFTNPCEAITMPKLEKPDMVALNTQEKALFLSMAKDNPYYDIFVFALNTGMRISEICGLTRDNVDLVNGYINVNQQLVRIKGDLILDTPKTKQSIRKIPINNTTRNILMKYMFSDISRLDYVFYNPNNHNQLVQNTLSINCHKIFQKCYELTKNEIFDKANFHSLRHTFATQWLMQNGNVALLSKVLGHTDTAFTMRVYVQPSNDDLKNEMLSLTF